MQPLKADTQVVVMLGPAVDSTDGVTLESGLVAAMDAANGIQISKNGGDYEDRAATVVATVYTKGSYRVTLKAGDVDTVGTLDVMYEDATTCLPMLSRFQVVNANVYDALFAASGTGYLQADVTQVLGTTLTEQSSGNIADNYSVFWDNDDSATVGTFLDRIEDIYTQLIARPTTTEFNARTLPSADYVVVSDTIAGVTLVDTCTTNTDMRGTNSANTVVPLAAATNQAEHDATQAAVANIPTVAEFNARTLLAANYGTFGEQEAAFSLLETVDSEVGFLVGRNPSYSAYENAIYVKASGSDSASGTEDQPYLTLTKAKTEATSGDIIVVGPGTYDEDDLAKDGVDWYFERGAKVIKTTTGSTDYIFDDGGVATVYNVLGKGHFEHQTKSYLRSSHVDSRTYHESSYINVDGRVCLNGNGYAKLKGEYFEGTDAIIDTVSATATCVLDGDELVVGGTGGWAVENDEGRSIVKARRITCSSSCVEMASAGGFVIIDAEEITSGNDGTINATVDCTVIIKNAKITDLNDDGSILLGGDANVTLINCVYDDTVDVGHTGTFRETNDVIDANVDLILADTAELQTNQGNWLTATGFSTHSAANVASVVLATPANLLDTNVDGEVKTSNPALGGGSAHTAAEAGAAAAAAILATPANLLATNATGQVETSNASGDGGDASGGVSIVLGALGHIPERVNGYELSVFNEEEITLVVPMYAPDTTPIDLTGQSLWFGIEGRTKEVLYTGVATGTETGFSVALARISKVQSGLTWALRRTSTGVLLGHGPFKITRRPFDAPAP